MRQIRAKEGGDTPAVSEDLLARLRIAEEEAQRLKSALAAVQAASAEEGEEGGLQDADVAKPAARIDGGDLRRETLFSLENQQLSWLSESDMPQENEPESNAEELDVVKRRLLLGLLGTAALCAFALVPTQQLQLGKPSKPLFFYLVPLLRSQQLLAEVEQLVPEGSSVVALRPLLDRILGPPNNLQQNLRDAAACLTTPRDVATAEAIGRDVYEYVQSIDYDKYFESMRGAPRDGAVSARYILFSLNSAKAAQVKLQQFLDLMPADQREAAAMQMASLPF